MNKSLKITLGLFVSGACLWLSFRRFDWASLPTALAHANWALLPLALVTYLCAHIFRAIRWALILSPVKKVHPVKLFFVLMFGFLVNNVLPARTGEFARGYAAAKLTGAPVSTCLGSIALERLTDMIGFIFLLLLSLQVFDQEKIKMGSILWVTVIGFVCLTVLIQLRPWMRKQSQQFKSPFLIKLATIIEKLVLGFKVLKSPKKLVGVVMATLLVWTAEATTVMLVSIIFSIHLNFLQACALVIGLCLGVMIPASPGYVGTYEFFGKQTLAMMGFDPNVALTFIVMLHFFQMSISSLLGVPLFIKLGLSVGQPSVGEHTREE